MSSSSVYVLLVATKLQHIKCSGVGHYSFPAFVAGSVVTELRFKTMYNPLEKFEIRT